MSSLKLIHETSPYAARNIIQTRRFIVSDILSDSGLNVKIINHPKGNAWARQAKYTGAELVFEWTGPVSTELSEHGYEPGILYDHYSHRGFIPVGTMSHLYLVDVHLKGDVSWHTVLQKPQFKLFRPDGWLAWVQSKHPRWLDQAVLEFQDEIENIVKNREPFKIVFPDICGYESTLRRRFPNIPKEL